MDKKVLGIVGVIVVAGIAIGAYYAARGDKDSDTQAVVSGENSLSGNGVGVPPPAVEPPVEPAVTEPKPGSPAALAYNDALKKYGNNRIQFDTTCQAKPSNVTFKSGTQVMFDNRAAKTRKIVFNGKTYSIVGYGYTVVPMTSSKYPATALVDCDASQNVATVLIQK